MAQIDRHLTSAITTTKSAFGGRPDIGLGLTESANNPNRTFDYSAAMGPGVFARDVILRRTISI